MRFDFKLLDFVECEKDFDKLAVCGSNKDLTWRELKNEVDIFKKKLQNYNLPKGHPVVIYGHKEVEFIVSILSCINLGFPYIPIDTIYPKDRLDKIVNIVKSSITINTIDKQITFNENNLSTTYLLDDPIIYIIFTSGSTGEPKGVQITQNSILDFQKWLNSDFGLSKDSVFMNQAPFSFDLSVYELVGFLSLGATIVLNSKDIIENHLLYFERLKKYSCNTWVSTPSFISKLLLSFEFVEDNLKDLRTFLFCGEVLPSNSVKRIKNSFPSSIVLNSYGPTEATVATTLIEITSDILEKYSKNLPVGYVKESSKINLLDIDEQNIGEIEIVGDNVSIGYFKNEELNKQKFEKKYEKRSFRTGDFGYFEDNLLFFANRKDELIKLHGFRIELGEIDKEIMSDKNISEAITIALKRGNEVAKIISFIVGLKSLDIEFLKENISKNLPYYMVPADIVILDKFPYNSNHKIDKNELINFYKNM
ncbi:D-alanine--poly(phosphoribitol) ligase [Aliarcobacter trophiarum LMG 25534]|uniref:D-alanine--[D-alanyl carrier protein] ligase n=1 Tax=Aliarcobacter trophiarum LMG 25534 TaxID=1032241 RepID=A0AAD0QLT7_9BACT|nr:AMP-binding protein [Aliarcobacter trophiarum]AXK49040.1 D-alanine--[D-alanyl carrier protein] ligase [Aliarcobacter trophiarum LMG 25534]RXJ89907.1 D-alanine--poly(phosphoribitol) ligase [Aliarcobacter trophiarum LMG 25534]